MTASANAKSLGDFDVETLRKFRQMAESHVRTATQNALTAAGDPSDFIDESFLDEFITVATNAWDEGIGVVTALFGDLPTPIFDSQVNTGIKNAAHYYDDLLRTMIEKNVWSRKDPIYGEFLAGNAVQYGDVRPLLSRLGGGSAEPTVQLAGGITSGTTMREWLRSNGIDTEKKIWLYGYEDPRRTFNGHLQMDGLVFDKWDDEGLIVAPQDAWLRRTHYQPGDHSGCGCIVAPYIPNMGSEFQLDL